MDAAESFSPNPGGQSVPKSKTNYLKIFQEKVPNSTRSEHPGPASLPGVLRAFRQATGWSLQYQPGTRPDLSQPTDLTWSAPVNPGVGATLGHFRLEPVSPADRSRAGIEPKAARQLASALGDLLGELLQAQHTLWQREAELAAGVPLVPHSHEQEHLASRLQAVLKGGAQAVGCHAAALYMLDEATTSLKLRSCWGLPQDRLLDAPRTLQGALADLEAMLGHAVVLEDTMLLKHWNAPEDFPSAVCVPVATPTTILGTLWMFCQDRRDFTDPQTNIIEITAGRVAADLEREMLLRESVAAAQWKRQLAAVERIQRNQLPSVPPLLDGWDLAGWSAQSQDVGGDFYDWFSLPDGLLALAVGDAMGWGLEAAVTAGTVRAALRSHAQYHRDAAALLKQVNLTLWTGSAGDQFASLYCGLLETATGRLCYSSAGQLRVVLLRADGWQSLSQATPVLGDSPESGYSQLEHQLQPGECIAIFTEGVHNAQNRHNQPLGEASLASPLMQHLSLPARDLVTIARDHLETHAPTSDGEDRTILILKRGKA